MTTINGLLPLNFRRIAATKGEAPSRILLLSDGDIHWAGLDGVFLDQETANRIISNFTTQGADLPIDHDHMTVKVEDGKVPKAPAAGWIKRLEYVEGEGLYAADVEWTPEAKAEIESKEYKYISPVILCVKDTKNIRELHSVALTNRPRTIGAPQLLAAARLLEPTKGKSMDPEKLKGVIEGLCKGLRIQAQDEIEDMPAIDDTTKAIADLIQALGGAGVELESGATLTTVLVAAMEFVIANTEGAPEVPEETPEEEAARVAKKKTDLEAAVKAGSYDKLAAEVKELREQANRVEAEKKTTRIDALIQKGVDENRLNPNDESQLKAVRTLAETDEEACATMIEGIEPYAPVGSQVKGGAAGRTQRDRAILAASREYDGNDLLTAAGGPSKRSYVNVALSDADQTELTDAESEKMEVTP